MDAPVSLTRTRTTDILDLNDDCIQEVFKYVHLIDLCALADVCHRFKRNAQSHFAAPKYKNDALHIKCDKKFGGILLKERTAVFGDSIKCDLNLRECTLPQKRLHIANVLRNFGMLVKFIKIVCLKSQLNAEMGRYLLSIFWLINNYCRGTLCELDLRDCDINISGEIENAVRPLLSHLQTLKLPRTKYSKLFGRSLSLWAPELRALHISDYLYHERWKIGETFPTNNIPTYSNEAIEIDDILAQSFPKLETISFRAIFNMQNDRLEEFLKLNPQLKRVALLGFPNVNGSIVQSIGAHVGDIEALELTTMNLFRKNNLKCIGKLMNLSTLTLYFGIKSNEATLSLDHKTCMTSILNEILVADIPLQRLHVMGWQHVNFEWLDQYFDAISKLKTLQKLWVSGLGGLEMSHILETCKQLKGLSELNLRRNGLTLSASDLLELIKCAEQLESLQYYELCWDYDEKAWRKASDNHLLQLDPRTELSESERKHNGFKRICDLAKKLSGPNAKADADYASDFALVAPFYFRAQTLKMHEETCMEAYPKMVQTVEQRRGMKRLLIKLNKYYPLVTYVPKDRKHHDILRIVEAIPAHDYFFEDIY